MPKELSENNRISIRDYVNEIAEIEPEEFDPNTHLPKVEHIVRAVDNVLEVSPIFQFRGQTFGYKFDLGKSKNSEERIGDYVLDKRRAGGDFLLTLNHYWARNDRHLFDRDSADTTILYRPESLELIEISRNIRISRIFCLYDFLGWNGRRDNLGFIYTSTDATTMWKK